MPKHTYCLVNRDFENSGQGEATHLLMVRERGQRPHEVGVFMVDTGCVGIKDAFFTTCTPSELDKLIQDALPGGSIEKAAAWGRKLIEDAVSYGQSLGFKPHRDYKKAARVLGGIKAADCDEVFRFGVDGKPFYVQGSLHSTADARRIIDHLTRRLGSDGFTYFVEDGTFPSVEDRVDEFLEIAAEGKRMDHAETGIDALAEEFPDNAYVCFGQGVMRVHRNQYVEAQNCFDRAVELDPEFAEAWANKAAGHAHRSESVAMARAQQKVLQLASPDSDLHQQMKGRLDDFADSIRELNGMELETYLRAEELYAEAINYFHHDEYDRAVRFILEHEGELPFNEITLNLLGLCYRRQSKFKQAREALEKALEIAPEHATARANLELIEAEEPGEVYPGKVAEKYGKLKVAPQGPLWSANPIASSELKQ